MDNHQTTLTPHVLFFPLPFQGPVNCMLKLAELFCFHGLQVTFLNTDYIQHRLLSFTDISCRFKSYAKSFRFETVPDGLPEDNPRTAEQLVELVDSIEDVSMPLFREIVRSGGLGSHARNPPTCIIADGAFSFAVDIAKEFGVPLMYFDTISPCGLWSILCANKLIQAGEFPFKDNDDLDAPVTSVPGMEGFLRCRDLPSFFRIRDQNDPIIQRILKEEQQMRQSHALIFNSFEDLEGPIISKLQTLTPNVYAIGPLHTHRKIRLDSEKSSKNRNSTNSIWKENKNCIFWLDKQPAKSVIYVSIGSLALMGKEQLFEIWHGLVNSEVKFLWVQRPGSITGLNEGNEIPWELAQATKERGCIVSWAPQEQVLAHPAIGGFLTHSGWNSTLESLVEGVPMICWPYFADQQVNSRYVGEVWKLGMDMKDTCDRAIVELMVRDLMEDRKDEFLINVNHMAKLAKATVSKGGSSYNALNRLIEDIKIMSVQASNW